MTQLSQFARLGLFDARVPRYTSYPTAPHFGDAVDAARFERWVSEITPQSTVSLYVHVPFCRRLCWFCACRTQGSPDARPVAAYVETLKAELRLIAEHLPDGVTLSRLHWGGGTPTLLTPDLMSDLAQFIAGLLPFADGAEFSVEIDPNEIDADRVASLAAAGMNRASIGVQDFDPEIQASIGRPQSFEITRDTVDLLRAAGIHSLNSDILFGLPHQTPNRIAETVQKLLSLSPDRIALYGYAHVPWMAKRQQLIPSDVLPTPQERLHLFDTARRLFVWDGYKEIGIDHFATPEDGLSIAQRAGRLRRNFQGYTDDTAEVLIGVGASAISRFPQGYAQNNAATSGYQKAIRAGEFATARGHGFTDEDRLLGRMIEMIMCDFRIDASEILDSFSIAEADLQLQLEQVAAKFEDLLTVTPAGLYIPDHARPLTRMIAQSLDAYSLSKAGHSPAM